VAIRYCDSQSTQYDTSVGHPWKFWSVDLIVKYKIRLWYLKRYLLLYPRGVRRGDPFLCSTPACYSSRHQNCFYISPRFVSSLLLFLFICVCVCVWGCCCWLTDKLQRARINPPAAAHQLCTSSILPPLLFPSSSFRNHFIQEERDSRFGSDLCPSGHLRNKLSGKSFFCLFRCLTPKSGFVVRWCIRVEMNWRWTGALRSTFLFFFSFFHFFFKFRI